VKGYLFRTGEAKMARFKKDAAERGRNFREHIEECLEAGGGNQIRSPAPDFPGKVTKPVIPNAQVRLPIPPAPSGKKTYGADPK